MSESELFNYLRENLSVYVSVTQRGQAPAENVVCVQLTLRDPLGKAVVISESSDVVIS